MIHAIIILLSFIILICLCVVLLVDDMSYKQGIAFIIGLISGVTIIVLCFVIGIKEEKEVKPIDVYRGNTTLQITYQDSIPIDSVVVFKQ